MEDLFFLLVKFFILLVILDDLLLLHDFHDLAHLVHGAVLLLFFSLYDFYIIAKCTQKSTELHEASRILQGLDPHVEVSECMLLFEIVLILR